MSKKDFAKDPQPHRFRTNLLVNNYPYDLLSRVSVVKPPTVGKKKVFFQKFSTSTIRKLSLLVTCVVGADVFYHWKTGKLEMTPEKKLEAAKRKERFALGLYNVHDPSSVEALKKAQEERKKWQALVAENPSQQDFLSSLATQVIEEKQRYSR